VDTTTTSLMQRVVGRPILGEQACNEQAPPWSAEKAEDVAGHVCVLPIMTVHDRPGSANLESEHGASCSLQSVIGLPWELQHCSEVPDKETPTTAEATSQRDHLELDLEETDSELESIEEQTEKQTGEGHRADRARKSKFPDRGPNHGSTDRVQGDVLGVAGEDPSETGGTLEGKHADMHDALENEQTKFDGHDAQQPKRDFPDQRCGENPQETHGARHQEVVKVALPPMPEDLPQGNELPPMPEDMQEVESFKSVAAGEMNEDANVKRVRLEMPESQRDANCAGCLVEAIETKKRLVEDDELSCFTLASEVFCSAVSSFSEDVVPSRVEDASDQVHPVVQVARLEATEEKKVPSKVLPLPQIVEGGSSAASSSEWQQADLPSPRSTTENLHGTSESTWNLEEDANDCKGCDCSDSLRNSCTVGETKGKQEENSQRCKEDCTSSDECVEKALPRKRDRTPSPSGEPRRIPLEQQCPSVALRCEPV